MCTPHAMWVNYTETHCESACGNSSDLHWDCKLPGVYLACPQHRSAERRVVLARCGVESADYEGAGNFPFMYNSKGACKTGCAFDSTHKPCYDSNFGLPYPRRGAYATRRGRGFNDWCRTHT